MAKTESTAVTAFINSVRQDMDGGYLKPSLGTNHPPVTPPRPAMPTPAASRASGTPAPTWSSPPPTTTRGARGTLPPPMPAPRTGERPAVRAPSQLIIPPHLQDSGETTPTPRVDIDPADDHWFDSGEHEQVSEVSALEAIAIDWEEFGDVEITDEDLNPTQRRRGWLLPVGGAVVLAAGAAVAAFIAFSGGSGDKLDAKVASVAAGDQQAQGQTATAAPMAAAAPVAATQAEPMPVAPVAPAAAEPAAADDPATAEPMPATPGGIVLRPANFTSDPPGAIVTLIMNGKPVTLGPAPVDAQLDPSKSYEVVFTMPGKPTVLRQVSFDGTGEIAIGVSLDGGEAADAPVAALTPDQAATPAPEAEEPEAAEEPEPVKKVTKRKARKRSRKARRSRSSSTKKTAAASSMKGNEGILMINAKPPCDLYVDGKKVGKTPQRSLALRAGKHTVKLVNSRYGINKSFGVKITKGKKTKVIKDLTDRMK